MAKTSIYGLTRYLGKKSKYAEEDQTESRRHPSARAADDRNGRKKKKRGKSSVRVKGGEWRDS